MSEAQRSGSPAVLSRGAFTVALIVLVAWCVFVVYMINTAGATELHWSRLAWLFTSVEAVAFGAAGAIFGSSIQRQRAERAEQVAQQHVQDAQRGRALAAALKADADSGAGLGSLIGAGPGGGQAATVGDAVARRHAELAERLFPS
jgi:uncharacterized membrane protein YsdA (DUF1294 family)